MLIRKTQQPSDYPENQIHDTYSTSTTDTYNCNYINSHNLKSSIIHFVTPINSTNYDEGWGGTYFYKTGSRVYLHVAITIPQKKQTNITTLPDGYRPRTKVINTCSGGNLGVYGAIQVNSDGNVYCYSDGINFFGDIVFDTFED
nr:MAG TPA: receptor binding protein [Caudoviricetes sp.]